MLAFAAHTGARRSEILRSRVEDIDFERGVVNIREKKNDTSREVPYRSVPMSTRLTDTLRDWLAVHSGGIHTFVTRTGDALTRPWAAELIRNVLRGSKWDVVPGWHCFRHSFISNCVAKGIDQRMIDHWVGHSTYAMRKRYSHLIPAVSQAALRTVFK